MIGWMNNWQYAADVPTSPWRGQMTVPRDLKLAGGPGGLRLIEEPIAELKQLRKTHIALNANERRELDTDTFELASVITTGKASELGWRLLAADGTFTLVGYDREKRQLFVDRTHSGDTRFSKYFPIRTNAPLEIGDGKLRLHILVDRSSIEVFAQDGRIAMTNLVFPPRNARGIEFYSKGETGPVEAELWTLGSIW